jgi:homoserine O-acetyltransferase
VGCVARLQPVAGLERIQAALLAINSADDERNPPETGIMDRELERVKNGHLYLILASDETRGHATICLAKFWKQQVQEFLETVPLGSMPGPQSAMRQSKAA